MEIEAPTFSSLNKPQKRALILRDRLRYRDPRHLDTYIEGITNDEPPTYGLLNGIVHPPLTLVTVKDTATRFDVGNVLFPEENNAVHCVHFEVEDGHIEVHTKDALDHDDANLDSVAIHQFIAGTMVPMFKDKFLAILARKNKINEARRAAYNMPKQPPAPIVEGKTLKRFDSTWVSQTSDKSQSQRMQKRRPGDPVMKHSSNARKQFGLDAIPDDMKSATFNTIPNQIKVDLFNNIVNTAFPSFDNLMMASWNVISIYSACGTDFPELHKAVIDLKDVLEDFDEALGMRVERSKPKHRKEFGPVSQNGAIEQALLRRAHKDVEDSQNSAAQDVRSTTNFSASQRNRSDIEVDQSTVDNSEWIGGMPPPSTYQRDSHPKENKEQAQDILPGSGLITEDNLRKPTLRPNRSPSLGNQRSVSVSSSTRSSSSQQRAQSPRERVKKVPQPNGSAGKEKSNSNNGKDSSPEAVAQHKVYASSISNTNKQIAAAARLDDVDEQLEHEQNQDQGPPLKKRKMYSSAQLRQRYSETKRNLTRTHGTIFNAPQNQVMRLQRLEEAVKKREQEEKAVGEMNQPVLGTELGRKHESLEQSMLGAKKPMGCAPVAPMLHNRKDMDR